MIPFSYPVGIIPQQELKIFTERNGEAFYKLDATFVGLPMEVVISSYVWRDNLFGKVQLSGYPYVYRDEDGRYILAWFAHKISAVDEDTPENNEVNLCIHVSRVQDLSQSRNSVDLLKFIGTQCSFDRKLVVLYCIAKDAIARRLSSLKAKDVLVGKGEICMHRGYRNISITEVTSFNSDTKTPASPRQDSDGNGSESKEG